MNPLDIIIIVILGYCVIRGLFRGLIKELTAIIALVVGFCAAYNYYVFLSEYLTAWIPHFRYLNITSFLIIFGLVVISVNIIGIIVKYVINFAFLGWIDRIFGVIFGFLKGGLIIIILSIIITAFVPKGSIFIDESLLFPYLSKASGNVVKIVPKDMKKDFDTMMKELNNR